MASQVKNDNSNFLVEENGDIVIVRSKENRDSQVSFYLFDDNIIDKISEFNSKGGRLTAREILDKYGLAVSFLATSVK